ncbi:MAG: DUF1573 domain-containing protein [Bacteroidia bacterium]
MRQTLFALLAIGILGFGTAAFLPGGPNTTFAKTSHDFGKIPQGKPVSYEFEFTNAGDAPLVLKKVKASCGCTTPFYPTEPIQPGQKSKIKAVYNAAGVGSFHKSITVTTNTKEADGTDKKIILFIKGEVVADNFKNNGNDKGGSPVRINN